MAGVAGAAAGACMTVVGQPFDTIKTRMQASSAARYPTTLSCFKQTVSVEGFGALWRGLQPALVATCATSGLRFSVQHHFNTQLAATFTGSTTKRLVRHRSSSGSTRKAAFQELPLLARVAAEGGGGAACGLVLPLIFTPLELIKVRRQVLKDAQASSWAIGMSVLRTHGLSGLYTGLGLTVARSTIGNATLFGSFEAWKAVLSSIHAAAATPTGVGEPHGGGAVAAAPVPQSAPWRVSVLAGVLSGWTTQAFIFPIDAAKSRIQAGMQAVASTGTARSSDGGGSSGSSSSSSSSSSSARDGQSSRSGMGSCSGSTRSGAGRGQGMLAALSALWREGAMYRGVSANLLRAVPVHMAYLPVFGLLMSSMAGQPS